MHHILNELVFGGMVLETHINEITARYEEQAKLEKQEASFSCAQDSSLIFTGVAIS